MATYLTGDPAADELLDTDPLAVLLGMLLDQQVTMESAFAGPAKLRDRLGRFDAATIANYDPEAFVELCRVSPAVHRYPGSMAGRMQGVCSELVENWDADASALWLKGDPDGAEVLRRLSKLPGFGELKARMFLALLGKQRGLTAGGWREASAPFGEEGSLRSVADIVDAESLASVREHKKAAKAAAKAAKAAKK